MKAFDKIIGYTEIKEELIQIADTLKNTDIYKTLGASSPRGLLLYGVPGVGKSLMAGCLIEASGRKAFTCRKTEPNGEFIKTIKDTFDRAVENRNAIVFLDDLDKFANNDDRHCDSEEFVTVQSCIDEFKEKDIFVLATANDIRKLPRSLVRAGRFDRMIEVDTPYGKDAEEIIRHYLSAKKLSENVDAAMIAAILDGYSCAALESVINGAGLLAGYQRVGQITMEHIMEASLRFAFKVPRGSHVPVDLSADSFEAKLVYHETGHAVISELLAPGSVSIVIARCKGEKSIGISKSNLRSKAQSLQCYENEIMISLGGRAATEICFGVLDTGAERDLDRAFEEVSKLVENLCYAGFHFHEASYERSSENLASRREEVIAAEIDCYYRKVKNLLYKNNAFFRTVAQALAEKGVLMQADIRVIRETCGVSEMAV